MRGIEPGERALDRRLGRDAGADDHQQAVDHRREDVQVGERRHRRHVDEDAIEARAQRVEDAAHGRRPEQLRRIARRQAGGQHRQVVLGQRDERVIELGGAHQDVAEARRRPTRPNSRCTRRPAQVAVDSSTRCWNSCAIVSARFAAVRLLPSPLFGLVMAMVRSARPLSARLMRVRSERYCSAASDVGASAATRCGSSCGDQARGASIGRDRADGRQSAGAAAVDRAPAASQRRRRRRVVDGRLRRARSGARRAAAIVRAACAAAGAGSDESRAPTRPSSAGRDAYSSLRPGATHGAVALGLAQNVLNAAHNSIPNP